MNYTTPQLSQLIYQTKETILHGIILHKRTWKDN